MVKYGVSLASSTLVLCFNLVFEDPLRYMGVRMHLLTHPPWPLLHWYFDGWYKVFIFYKTDHAKYSATLRWRHNGRDGVSNHQPHQCLLNRLFRRRSKKTSKLRVTGPCTGNSPVNSPHKWPVMQKMFPFHDVIMYSHVMNWGYHRTTRSTTDDYFEPGLRELIMVLLCFALLLLRFQVLLTHVIKFIHLHKDNAWPNACEIYW